MRRENTELNGRIGYSFNPSELQSVEVAQEIALVGIIPSRRGEPAGKKFTLAGQQFVVTGTATREEFLQAVEAAGLPVENFSRCPVDSTYLRISTD